MLELTGSVHKDETLSNTSAESIVYIYG